jgi:L-malate glycosyltransferase
MYAPLRVLVLTDWFPDGPDDMAGVFVREQALAVARRHEVTVLHLQRPGGGNRRLLLEDDEDGPLRVLRVRCRLPLPFTVVSLWAVTVALARLRRRRQLPHLLHAHEMAAGLAAILAGRSIGRPVVLSEHFSGFALAEVDGIAARVARFAFAHADLVCPVSESLRGSLEQGGWGGNLRVVPNVVDTELFTPGPRPVADERTSIVTVAALEPVKGVQELVEAVGILRHRRDDFRLELIGDGSLRGELERRAAELGLDGALLLRGKLKHDALPGALRRAGFAVVPSRWETFSVAMGEAMACGLPVVATAVGGIVERIDSGNGILCCAQDPAALAAAISEMLDQHHGYDRAAIAAGVRARFSTEAVVADWERVYADAFQRRQARSRSRYRGQRGK